MFCQLFGVDAQPHVAKPKHAKTQAKKAPKVTQRKTKKPNPKPKSQEPEPQVIENGAPYEHVKEDSPDPCEMDTLMYEELEQADQHDDDWESEVKDDESLNYDATSISEKEDSFGCSVESSPGMFFERKLRSVIIEKKRPPGIAVTFDDDSWID